jgi:hypothetical protein
LPLFNELKSGAKEKLKKKGSTAQAILPKQRSFSCTLSFEKGCVL